MRALVFDGNALAFAQRYPEPQPGSDDALIRVTYAGICSTDLEILRGYADFRGVPGHEFVGVVQACDARPELVGRRVVGEINIGCERCDWCRRGRRAHCLQRRALGIRAKDGVFADLVTLPAVNLHPVPDQVADCAAVFAEPLAAALQIRQQAAIRPGDRLAVLGDGKLGQLVARSLAHAGCELAVVCRQLERRSAALLRAQDIATVEANALPDGWADLVVDCTGHPSGFETALRLLRAEGTLVLKSTYAGRAAVDLTRVVVQELVLVGSRCGPFEPALRLLAQGEVDPLPLIDAIYPLDQGEAAFAHAAGKGVLKVLLQP